MEPSRDDIFQMVAALVAVARDMERSRRSEDVSKLVILQTIAFGGKVRPSDIASELGVHQSTVTRQVQALEASGYVVLMADPEDLRSYFLTLSRAGQDEMSRLTEIGLTRFGSMVAGWDAEEVRTLARLLQKLEASKAPAAVSETAHAGGGSRWRKRS